MNSVNVVNIVGSGEFSAEFALDELSSKIGEPESEYDPEKHPGLYLRFEGHPVMTVYRTGRYIIYGASTIEEIELAREFLLEYLFDIGAIEAPTDSKFSIQNIVSTEDVGQSLNLNQVVIQLGLERAEYEPEQFPGLIYRPESGEYVLLIFGSGKIVITGVKDVQSAQDAFEELKQLLSLQ